MSIVCYFKEPATYTLSLKRKVYDSLSIETRFLKSNSLTSNQKVEAISTYSLLKTIKLLWKDSKTYQLAVFNGFYDKELFLLLLFSYLHQNNLKIALESDTPLRIPNNPVKQVLKKWVLYFLFSNSRIYGFSGGSGSHKDLFRFYGMNENRIILMPMVVNNNDYKGRIRKRGKYFEFIFVGNIELHKNVRQLLEAFEEQFDNDTAISLRIVGDGSKLSSLKKEFSVSNIIFEGKLFGNNLKKAYTNASALVLPSLSDAWGLVINEAMAEGLPVISSKFVGANYDLLEGKETGLVFDPEIKGDLGDKMKRMCTDVSYYHKASENAFNLLHSYWNYDLYSKQLLLAIDKMKND